jgi:4-amino-4-deoxy-L-arabinose transferase-like glycosyltransferase
MRQLLKKLENSRSFWFLLSILLVFFILRLPSLIEPYWYGDEGIYQVIGDAMSDGRLLYADIYDNKPPLLYVLYALFDGDQFSLRVLSLLFGIGAVVVFYFLVSRLINRFLPTVIATSIFAFYFAIPYIEGNIANAENFMLFPILTAAYLVVRFAQQFIANAENKRHNKKITFINIFGKQSLLLFLAGLVLGIAFLFKIVAFFDFAAFAVFLIMLQLQQHELRQITISLLTHIGLRLLPYVLGFIVPFILSICYFLLQGELQMYLLAAFSQNVGYVGWKNQFVIPQGLLVFKIILLCTLIGFLFLKRKSYNWPVLFIFIWFGFSLFSAFFSQRPYTHYVLVALASICLVIAFIFSLKKLRLMYLLLFIMLLLYLKPNFYFYGAHKTLSYYDNYLRFISEKKSVTEYESFFDPDVPRDNEIAAFLKARIKNRDDAFIWGNSAQIYKLSGTLPPGRYTVAYHMIQTKQSVDETLRALQRTKPEFIVIMPDIKAVPFSLREYTYITNIQDVAIYKKTLYEDNSR